LAKQNYESELNSFESYFYLIVVLTK